MMGPGLRKAPAVPSAREAFHFIAGVMSASLSWFFGLTFGVHRLRRFMTLRTLRPLNAVCGGRLLFLEGKSGRAFFSMIP